MHMFYDGGYGEVTPDEYEKCKVLLDRDAGA